MSDYDLQSLKLPKLTGTALRLLAAALDWPPTRSLLLPSWQSRAVWNGCGRSALKVTHAVSYAPVGKPAKAPLTPRRWKQPWPGRTTGVFTTIRDMPRYRTGTATPVKVAGRIWRPSPKVKGPAAAPRLHRQ